MLFETVSAGENHTIGLKKDGTVVSTTIYNSELDYGKTAVNGWGDMVAVSTGYFLTVGLKKDGTVVSTKIINKEFDVGQTNVESWKLF